MWTKVIQPRFSETDALGHINNTVLPIWFEEARTPLFELFCPNMDTQDWHLIIAKIEVEFLAELKYGAEVTLRTVMQKVGNSSMVVGHEAWQNQELKARGSAVMIHFDHIKKQSKPIADDVRLLLQAHQRVI